MGRMKMVAAAMFVVGVSAGCAPPSKPARRIESSHEIAEAYGDRVATTRSEMVSDIWWPTCDEAPRGGRGCGLLTDRMTAEWIDRFIREGCEQDPTEDMTEECRQAIHDHVVAAFKRRYTRGNERDVWVNCSRRAEGCNSFVTIELLFMASHNSVVMADAERRIANLTAEHKQAQAHARREREARQRQADEDRRALAALAGALQGMSASLASSQAPVTPSGGCQTDFDCGGSGKVCAKPTGQITGECATLVDKYGMQKWSPPRANYGPGQRQCTLASECGIGFTCDQGRCMK